MHPTRPNRALQRGPSRSDRDCNPRVPRACHAEVRRRRAGSPAVAAWVLRRLSRVMRLLIFTILAFALVGCGSEFRERREALQALAATNAPRSVVESAL